MPKNADGQRSTTHQRPSRQTIADGLAHDGIDYLLAQWVDIHGTPRCKGVPASAIEAFLGGSAGFAGAATVGMGQGPHSHDLIGMPDLKSYTVVPWETGVARWWLAPDGAVPGYWTHAGQRIERATPSRSSFVPAPCSRTVTPSCPQTSEAVASSLPTSWTVPPASR